MYVYNFFFFLGARVRQAETGCRYIDGLLEFKTLKTKMMVKC